MQDSYFIYDDQDRLICETTNSVGSCPTSGSNIKNSRTTPYFTSAGDWLELLCERPVERAGIAVLIHPGTCGSAATLRTMSCAAEACERRTECGDGVATLFPA